MYHYLFTNDLRISNLESFLIDAGKCFVEDRVPSAYEDKNANNNMNTLGFYFNLTQDSNCAKSCANGKIRPVILNFIKKFQFPNPRTTESLNDSINDNINLAPLRTIIQVLYFMNNINKNEAYLSDAEIASYIFFNDKIAKNETPDILSLAKEIITERQNNVVLMSLDDDNILNNNGFYWKQCKRQLREMIKVLTWSGCAIKDNNGNIKLHNDNLSIENKAELFDILSYSKYWKPDKNKNANENKKSYQEYMDMAEIKINEFNDIADKDLFKEFYFERIENTIEDCKNAIELRNAFIQEYPLSRINEMTLDEYALGGSNFKNSLSYKLEFGKYSGMIGIGGNTAKKHGVYINKDNNIVVNGEEITENINETWIEFRKQLYSFLIEYESANIPIKATEKYPMLKGMAMVLTKLLFLYYPNKFTSIASRGKLIDLLDYFNYEYDSNSQAEELNFILYKNIRENYEFTKSVDSQCLGNILWDFINSKIESIDYIVENNEEYTVKTKYSEKEFLDEVFIDKEELDSLLKLIQYSKNIILQGAPGVGKTYIAKRLAYAFMGEKNEDRILSIQFHQSYSYEEFIEGIRPDTNGNFKVITGAFKEFCEKAQNSNKPYFCIIDEINRGNISKILGELMMLIEKDKRGEEHTLVLPYSKKVFYVPENIYIIGTMNTADRSIAVIDYALRRFAFYNNKPYFNNQKFIDYINSLNSNKLKNLINIIKDNLNKDITEDESLGEGFLIGHSYFCGMTIEDIDTRLSQIVNYEIIPSLREYWFDNDEKYNDWKRQLKGAINE